MTNIKITTERNLKVAFNELMEVNPLLELEDRTLLNGIDYKVFKNAPKTLRDLFDLIGMLNGDFPFMLDNNIQYSYYYLKEINHVSIHHKHYLRIVL